MATMKIQLEDNYFVLPYTAPALQALRLQDNEAPANSVPGSPSSSMTMTSPERTLSFGAVSVASTLPSSAASVRSSFEIEQQQQQQQQQQSVSDSSSSSTTTSLKGKLLLTLPKPTKVASLAISLNGSTHIAFLGTGKRSHYSRHHIRSQQFLIEPRPDSEQYTLLGGNDGNNNNNKEFVLEFPFSIEVPNHLPASVTTPQGGTIYRLTAVLTLAKSAGIMSFLSTSSTITASTPVQIYRAPRPRYLSLEDAAAFEGEGEEEEGEEGEEHASKPGQERGVTRTEPRDLADGDELMPATVHHIWPGQVETTVVIPFTQLPSQSKPDLRIRVRVLRENLAIKSFQAALWERAIFRVQKAGAPANSKKYTIGVRERVVSAQRCDAGWVNDAITTQLPHTFEKVVLFSIPNAVRSHNELYSSRICNVSTFTSASKLKKRHLKVDRELKDSEFGEVSIEIQHFIRYSLFVTGSVDLKGKTITTPVERYIGDVPVIVRGMPSGPECDRTGLPTYLYSFSTSRVSYEEAQDYEIEAAGMAGGDEALFAGYDGTGPIYGDYENDDALMALMGYRGSRTPPSYEDTVGSPSLDASISDLQNMHISTMVPTTTVTHGLGIRGGNNGSNNALGLTR
ncbi:hypothetical protein BGZ79_009746 [Entomortierella chlamydospora]|nr:hypothetical protein BGZ79_009746 [Entomortierella chlamydospora]